VRNATQREAVVGVATSKKIGDFFGEFFLQQNEIKNLLFFGGASFPPAKKNNPPPKWPWRARHGLPVLLLLRM
jgi:hypothetical protein